MYIYIVVCFCINVLISDVISVQQSSRWNVLSFGVLRLRMGIHPPNQPELPQHVKEFKYGFLGCNMQVHMHICVYIYTHIFIRMGGPSIS